MPNQYTALPLPARFLARVSAPVPAPTHATDFGPCVLWKGFVAPDGYGQFWLNGRTYVAHKAAWLIASDSPVPPGMKVCHTCDVRRCVQTEGVGAYEVDGVLYERRGHLWLGTTAANQTDMVAKGRSLSGERNNRYTHPETTARGDGHGRHTHPEQTARGTRHGNAKLTEKIVLDLRARYALGGVSLQRLANEVGVGKDVIGRIIQRKAWNHI